MIRTARALDVDLILRAVSRLPHRLWQRIAATPAFTINLPAPRSPDMAGDSSAREDSSRELGSAPEGAMFDAWPGQSRAQPATESPATTCPPSAPCLPGGAEAGAPLD